MRTQLNEMILITHVEMKQRLKEQSRAQQGPISTCHQRVELGNIRTLIARHPPIFLVLTNETTFERIRRMKEITGVEVEAIIEVEVEVEKVSLL